MNCRRIPIALLGLALLVPPATAHASGPAARLTPPARTLATPVVVPWGEGAQGLGFRAALPDFPADGVAAVAVAPDGSTWVLDRLNRRVVRLAGEPARVVESHEVGPDADDLAIGPDGAVAVYSPLRAKVWLFDQDGPAGELPVPREFEEVQGIGLTTSRQVTLTTSYQQLFRLGSPGAVQVWGTIQQSGRDGAVLLANGDGVQVRRRDDGRAELVVIAPGEHAPERARFVVGQGVLAARVVGVAGDAACVRLETEAQRVPLKVGRRVVCLDAKTGVVLLDEALPAPGAFVPRRELAVGGSPARVVHISPQADGLHVRTRIFGRGGAR